MLNVRLLFPLSPSAFSLHFPLTAYRFQPLAFSLGYLVRIFAGFAAKGPNETR
jgi:hypothetical protein